MNQFEQIFQAFQQANIQYLVVGGVAVNLYGYARMTADLELIIALEEENMERMDKLMKSLGYIPRLPVDFKDLKNAETVRKLVEDKGMKAYTFLDGNSLFSIDILAEDSLSFSSFEQKKTIMQIDEHLSVPVVALSDLIVLKKRSGRPEDLRDIQALEDLRQL